MAPRRSQLLAGLASLAGPFLARVGAESVAAALGSRAVPTGLRAEVDRLRTLVETLEAQVQSGTSVFGRCCDVNIATTATTTTTSQPAPVPSLCAAFGDPHFITFDGAHTTFVGDWVLWLVKSEDVWIQIRSKDSDGKLMGIAFGGAFMDGHTLVLHKESHDGPIHTVFDGHRILNHTSDEFHLPGVVEAYRRAQWEDGMHSTDVLTLRTRAKFDVGPWPSRFSGAPEGGIFLLRLSHQVEVTLTGVDFLSVVVSMPPQAGGQGGYCGNFNGNPDDDAEPVAPSWDRAIGPDLLAVPDSENLFRTVAASLLGLTSETSATDRSSSHLASRSLLEAQQRLDACPPELRQQAEVQCAQILDARIRQDCVFDACMAGRLDGVAGTFAADILQEAVNARGISMFLGHGECLDQAGRRYRVVETRLRTDDECSALLRQLAAVRGVLGAQLRRGSVCQVVVEPGTDPTAQLVPGGWGDVVEPQEPSGRGLVSGATDDAAWSCWQLN